MGPAPCLVPRPSRTARKTVETKTHVTPHDVRAVAEHEVGAGIDHRTRDAHDVAARFPEVLFFRERDARGPVAFGAANTVKSRDSPILSGATSIVRVSVAGLKRPPEDPA